MSNVKQFTDVIGQLKLDKMRTGNSPKLEIALFIC